MFEKSILQDIAEQNFLKYEVNYKSPKPVIVSRENTRMVVCLLWKLNLIKNYISNDFKGLGIFWPFRSNL